MNAKKTKFMAINLDNEESSMHVIDGSAIEHVSDFKYLGSYIADSRKVFNTKNGIAWSAICMHQASESLDFSHSRKSKSQVIQRLCRTSASLRFRDMVYE